MTSLTKTAFLAMVFAVSLAAITMNTPESAMGAPAHWPVVVVKETLEKGGTVKLQGGTVTVPEAYSHEHSTDQYGGKSGRIFQEGGFNIAYATYSDPINACAPIYHNVAAKVAGGNQLWFKEKKVNNQVVNIAYFKPNNLAVSFPQQRVNFRVIAKSPEEIDKALAIIMTYADVKK